MTKNQDINETGVNDYIFSIYDNVAQIFEPPFTEKNKGTAIRRIQDLIQNNSKTYYFLSSQGASGAVISPLGKEDFLLLLFW